MTPPVRAWLPSTVLTPPSLTDPLAAVLGAWRERWFPAMAMGIATVERASEPDPPPSELIYQVNGAYASATLDGRRKRHLVEGALDVSLLNNLPNDSDHRLLDAFATSILEDLVGGLDALLKDVASDLGQGEFVRLGISSDSQELVAVIMDEQHAFALLRASSRAARSRTEPLSSRTDAMKSAPVAIDAMLGRAELSIEELENLRAGDVLVLDRDISEKVDLCPIGQDRAIGRGRLQLSEGRVEVHF
jgi:flagellar motor switch/type III secretory pathway protein FliN